jgi:hypothetical protein
MKRHNHSWELRRTWILALMVVLAVPAFSKRKHSQDAAPQQPESGQANLKSGSLDQVLRRMDESAAKFRNAQADFVWTPYNSVINETEAPDKGKIYFRKVDNETQMAATIQPPDDRQIVSHWRKSSSLSTENQVVGRLRCQRSQGRGRKLSRPGISEAAAKTYASRLRSSTWAMRKSAAYRRSICN